MSYQINCQQSGDALELLQSLPDAYSPLVFFDPQHRSTLARLAYGNEGTRQAARCALPQMSDGFIEECDHEIVRVLAPSGYLALWSDAYRLLEGYHKRIALKAVDLIAWNNGQFGMGYRTRRCGDYLVILQKAPILAKRTWTDHGIRDRWDEKVDRRLHPHIKPVGLITRLIGATTKPGNIVIDPAAGSFVVMRAAHELGREFIGVDCSYGIVTDSVDPEIRDQLKSIQLGINYDIGRSEPVA